MGGLKLQTRWSRRAAGVCVVLAFGVIGAACVPVPPPPPPTTLTAVAGVGASTLVADYSYDPKADPTPFFDTREITIKNTGTTASGTITSAAGWDGGNHVPDGSGGFLPGLAFPNGDVGAYVITGDCPGKNLQPGQECTVVIVFFGTSPTPKTSSVSSKFDIRAGGNIWPVATYATQVKASIEISPADAAFNNGQERAFVVTNNAASSLTNLAISIDDDPFGQGPAGFATGTQPATCTTTLAPGGTCTTYVKWTETANPGFAYLNVEADLGGAHLLSDGVLFDPSLVLSASDSPNGPHRKANP